MIRGRMPLTLTVGLVVGVAAIGGAVADVGPEDLLAAEQAAADAAGSEHISPRHQL
jgi:hypothetical protein